MELTAREAARLLNVTTEILHRWVRERGLPAHRVLEHYQFNRSRLLEWATAEGIPLSPEGFRVLHAGGQPPALVLAPALESGGIFYDLAGQKLQAVLKELVDQIPLPSGIDRAFLLRMLLARERLGSTGIGEGIAIPHVRNPIVLRVRTPMVALAFLRQPIDFHAVDEKPVDVLFTLISPTVRMHLTLLSRLAFVLHDPDLRQALNRRAVPGVIQGHFSRIETSLGRL